MMFLRWKRQTVKRCASWDTGCQHKVATERVTPQVLESYRQDGVPKHRVLWTGPSFRMCCARVKQVRVWWWRQVVTTMRAKRGNEVTTLEWQDLLARIAEVVSRPMSEEDAIYENGYLDHCFRCQAPNETWDAYEARTWAEATKNYLNGVPKMRFETFTFGGQPRPATALKADPRVLLGLPRVFTKKELTEAYRKAAKIHHPDRGGDAGAFCAVTEAFNVLQSGAR